MIRGIFGDSSLSARLRGGLEEASATQRGIGRRVAEALQASTATGFAAATQGQFDQAKRVEADVQREMASLADTQLQFEADVKLLRETYQRFRTAINSRG